MDNVEILKVEPLFNAKKLIEIHSTTEVNILEHVKSDNNSKEVIYELLEEALKEIKSMREDLKERNAIIDEYEAQL
jgi:hypothetical protein